MENPVNIIYIVGAIMLLFIYYIFIKPIIENNKRDKESLKNYRDTYLTKQGATTLWTPDGWNNRESFSYRLKTFDGGQNWYATEYKMKTKELIILGPVEKVYPGLFEHLSGMDKLTDHVSKNGPINLGDKDDVNVLTDAGFTVTKKPK